MSVESVKVDIEREEETDSPLLVDNATLQLTARSPEPSPSSAREFDYSRLGTREPNRAPFASADQLDSSSLTRVQSFLRRHRAIIAVGIVCVVAIIAVIAAMRTQDEGSTPTPWPQGQPGPVFLISLDGFRAEYLTRPDLQSCLPNINQLLQSQHGIAAESMQPVFPSKTFPNHYTLVTGLYAESHGIVDNYFYDPILDDSFAYNDDSKTNESKWWLGEPVWVTAHKWRRKSVLLNWPGSTALIGGVRPDFTISPYDPVISVEGLVNLALSKVDLLQPHFVAVYMHDVDAAGHSNGVSTSGVQSAVCRVDAAIGRLISGLKDRSLFDISHIVIVSDHGMVDVDPTGGHTVYLEDYLDMTRSFNSGGRPNVLLRPSKSEPLDVWRDEVLKNLSSVPSLASWPIEQVPINFHLQTSPRIGPVVALPAEGWYVQSTRVHTSPTDTLKATHGYNNSLSSMQSIFIAHGSAFTKSTSSLQLDNTAVYPLVCLLLRMPPAPNNGSLNALVPFINPDF